MATPGTVASREVSLRVDPEQGTNVIIILLRSLETVNWTWRRGFRLFSVGLQ